MKKIVVIVMYLFLLTSLKAQNFTYKVNFDFFFDNLEGSSLSTPSRTLVATKLSPKIGVRIKDKHQFMIGASVIQYSGDSALFAEKDYTIYYKFTSDKFNVITGVFPRSHSIGNYPRSFFREDFLFRDNNIDGIIAQYIPKNKNGFVEFYLDWYKQNQKLRTDQFTLTASTEFCFFNNLLIIGASASLNHYNNLYILDDTDLYENALYNVYIATDLSSLLPQLDKFRIGFGKNSSLEHKRSQDTKTKWKQNIGWQLDIDINWKGLGFKNEFYLGDPQLMYYNQYGDNIYWGSRFYQAKQYNYTELYYQRKWDFISIKISAVLHITPDQISNQQILTLGFNLHQMIKGGKTINIW